MRKSKRKRYQSTPRCSKTRRCLSTRCRRSKFAQSTRLRRRGVASVTVQMKRWSSFGDLQECIQRTFSTSATYLPEVWTYWSKSDSDYYALPEEDTHERSKIPRTRYVSHPYINLATLKDTLKSDEVSLITSCTSNKVTRDILISPGEWLHGVFQVVCCVPEKYHDGITYDEFVGVKYQILSSTPFSVLQLNHVTQGSVLEESIFHSVAELFLMLLNHEFGSSNRYN